MKTTRTMEQTKRIILWLPERTIFYGDIVCEGKELDVYIEDGCKVDGDIFANGVIIQNDVTVRDISAKENIIIGEGCHVKEVLTNGNVRIGSGTHLDSVDIAGISQVGDHVICEEIIAGGNVVTGTHCQIDTIKSYASISLGDFTEVDNSLEACSRVYKGKNVIIP